jgi:hypothetical protein
MNEETERETDKGGQGIKDSSRLVRYKSKRGQIYPVGTHIEDHTHTHTHTHARTHARTHALSTKH